MCVCIIGMFATTAPALAYSCNPTPPRGNSSGNWFDGWQRTSGSTVGGVYSDIYNYVPYVYPGASNAGVSAWTMLANGQNWAQVGWTQYPQSRWTFIQWTIGVGNIVQDDWYPQPTGQYTYYTTLYNGADFVFEVAGSVIDSVVQTFTPNEAENFGELATTADQMPGGTTDPEVFKSTEWYVNGGWQPLAGAEYQNPPEFGYSPISNTQIDIWDPKCSS